jgi:hypothetical protein
MKMAMKIDNSVKQWEAFCITESGEYIEWRGLRFGQAKWRYQFLKRGMLWRGQKLKACGYQLDRADQYNISASFSQLGVNV